MPSLMPIGKQQYTNNAGVPLAGGRVYTFAAGTTEPKATYQDAAGTVENPNPIILNARGEALAFWNGAYSVKVTDANDIMIYTVDNYQAPLMPEDLSAADGVKKVGNAADKRDLAASSGAGGIGFDYAKAYQEGTLGWALQTCGGSFNLWRLIPPAEWAAITNGTSAFDITPLLTAAIATYKDVFVPPGVYSVNPDVGVLLVKSMHLRGAGQNQTIFAATPQGGTLGELASYVKGSIFKRAYTPNVANPRLDTVHLSDFAIVMNHPTAAVTTTEIQIGLDLRHIGRFEVERVWVGNVAPLGGRMAKADPGPYAAQGYAYVWGNVDTGNPGYCGGEVGRIQNCSAVGAYKLMVGDDEDLSPLSGAHNVNVISCDIQGGHTLLAQEQQYTSGNLWDGNAIQDIRRRPGDLSPTYVMRMAGYDNEIRPGYIEAGVADYFLRFESASNLNRVSLTHYSATTIGIAAFSDVGRRNRIEHRKNSGAFPGGLDSKGVPVVLYDRAYDELSIICHWDGAGVVVDGGFGITPTRPTAAGDMVFTFDLPYIDANRYTAEVSFDTNASGHGGMHSIISRSASNIRIQFYAQNGAETTPIDPRSILLRIKQIP